MTREAIYGISDEDYYTHIGLLTKKVASDNDEELCTIGEIMLQRINAYDIRLLDKNYNKQAAIYKNDGDNRLLLDKVRETLDRKIEKSKRFA